MKNLDHLNLSNDYAKAQEAKSMEWMKKQPPRSRSEAYAQMDALAAHSNIKVTRPSEPPVPCSAEYFRCVIHHGTDADRQETVQALVMELRGMLQDPSQPPTEQFVLYLMETGLLSGSEQNWLMNSVGRKWQVSPSSGTGRKWLRLRERILDHLITCGVVLKPSTT